MSASYLSTKFFRMYHSLYICMPKARAEGKYTEVYRLWLPFREYAYLWCFGIILVLFKIFKNQ